MADAQVLPCAHCGKRNWRFNSMEGAGWLECVSCGATGPAATGAGDLRVPAIEAWNRRPGDRLTVAVDQQALGACVEAAQEACKHRADCTAPLWGMCDCLLRATPGVKEVPRG